MLKSLILKKINIVRLNFIYPFLISIFVIMSFQQAASAAQAVIGWNASSGPVAGYDVYYGTSSGNYTTTLDVGKTTTTTLQNLSSPVYYITVAAYSASSDMSPLSSKLVIYGLNASAGAGGSVNPSGIFYQSSGKSQTFTFTPASGYVVSDVRVDGNSVGPVASYTFSDITASHTISATFLPSAVLWQNATDHGGGWESLSWLGYFNTTYSPWIYHETLGWLYPLGASTDSIWFWDESMNAFFWTSATVYPYVYRASDQAWLWYEKGTSNPQWFYNFKKGSWEKH